VNTIKDTAITEITSTRNIISNVSGQTSVPVIGQLPIIKSLSRTIQRTRVIKENAPVNPSNTKDLIIPEIYKLTNKNEAFLAYDSGSSESRILIFTTQYNLNMLQETDDWFGDGTFKSVPSIFSQLYTIHCYTRSLFIPLVYILMTSRTKEVYAEVLRQLLVLKPDLNPKSIKIDFEQSFVSAFKQIFPNAHISGCFFHFGQCVWRKVQSTGLQKKYAEDSTFALHVKQLCDLAFVPVLGVVESFNTILESQYFIDNEQLFEPIVDYFEETWIGRTVRNRRKKPLFPIEMWNCYDNVINDQPRTNNAVEGWHQAFNASLGCHHTTIWKFISFLKQEQGLQEAKLEKINLVEKKPNKKKKKYKSIDQRLKNTVENYETSNIITYLKGIAHNFNL